MPRSTAPRPVRRPIAQTPQGLRAVRHLVWLGLAALLALAAVNIGTNDSLAQISAGGKTQGLRRAA